jgi:uncharacterized protein with PIN domain
MREPAEQIRITCPECGTTFEDWYPGAATSRADEEVEPMGHAFSTCPGCSHQVSHRLLVEGEDGTWTAPPN